MFDISFPELHERGRLVGRHDLLAKYTAKVRQKNQTLVETVEKHKIQPVDPVPSLQKKRKRRKLEEEDETDETGNQKSNRRTKVSPFGLDCSANEGILKIRKIQPDETFELWHQQKFLNRVLERHSAGSKVKEEAREDDAIEDGVREQRDDDGIEEEDHGEEKKPAFSQVNHANMGRGDVAEDLFVLKRGFEILPKISTDRRTPLSIKAPGLVTKHTISIYKLLFLNIMKRKWKLAYRCFSLLIRMEKPQLRELWPLGIEILQRLAEDEAKKKYPELTQYDLNTRNYLHMNNSNQRRNDFDMEEHVDSEESGFLNRDNMFFEWLITNFPVFRRFEYRNIFFVSPVPYRFGTNDISPLYVTSHIWNLILQRKFDQADEKLSQLILTQPYLKDGMFHYMQGVSYQYRAVVLSQDYDTVDLNSEKIEKLISDSKKSFNDAKNLNFNVPETLFNGEYSMLRNNLYDKKTTDYDSETEGNDSETMLESSDVEGKTRHSKDNNVSFSKEDFVDEFEAFERNLASKTDESGLEMGRFRAEDDEDFDGADSGSYKRHRNIDSEDDDW